MKFAVRPTACSVGNKNKSSGFHLRTWVPHFLACAALFVGTAAAAGFDACLHHFPHRMAPQLASAVAAKARPLCFDAFAILHSGASKTPLYGVARLNARDFDGARKHKRGRNPFYEEARVPRAERSTLDDYKARLPDGARMDRGHVVPAGDMTSERGFAQSFSLANMVPQVPAMNQGAWNRIEQATRQYVKRARGDVYVFTGPVFDRAPRRLGPGGVWIPSALFKLVYDATTRRSWVHLVANDEGAKAGRPISYEEFVERTGLQLLPELQ